MGKAGRIACIFTPYALTLAALVCIILVGLGCTSQNSSTLTNFYFFRADLKNFTSSGTITSEASQLLQNEGINLPNNQLTALLQKAQQTSGLKDFYSIGLWGYCDGNISSSNVYDTTMCSKAQADFWFNPIQVWGLNGTDAQAQLPSELKNALTVYKDVSIWMFIAYIVAAAATAAELVVGIFAICSRWGSCVTTLVATVATLFTIAASVTATALFATLTGTFNTVFKDYGIRSEMGHQMFVTTWLAVAFSVAGTLFWIISSCCCSGRSSSSHSRDGRRRVNAEKAPYTYEPLGTPAAQGDHHRGGAGSVKNAGYTPPLAYGHAVPMQNMESSAYEPYRHV